MTPKSHVAITINIFSILLCTVLFSFIFATKARALQDQDYGWTRVIGGTGSDTGKVTVFDSQGNIYLGGIFSSSPLDFDHTAGVDLHTSYGVRDICITKYSSSGGYLWTRSFGGTGNDRVWGIDVDDKDNVYIAGQSDSPLVHYDGVNDTDIRSNIGSEDVYITKYDKNGNYVWTNHLGGTGYESINRLIVDNSENVIVVGNFMSTDLDLDPGAGNTNYSATVRDIFIAKYSEDGDYLWSKMWGGEGHDNGYGVSVDDSDNIYMTGYFSGTDIDFDPSAGTDNHTSNGGTDAYVTKFSSDGTYQWTKTIGGTSNDTGNTIIFDENDGIIYTGYFSGTAGTKIDFDPSGAVDQHSTNGDADIFVSKLTTSGTYSWTETIGGTGYDSGNGLDMDEFRNVFLTGFYTQTDSDWFFSKVFANGTLAWTYILGGVNTGAQEYSRLLAANQNGKMTIAGTLGSSNVDFDITSGTDTRSHAGQEDLFLSVYTDNDRFRITPAATFDVVDEDRGADASVYARDFQGFDHTINVKDSTNSNWIADIEVDVFADLDWSGASADSDTASGKSFFHYPGGLSSLPGSSASTYSLYIPIPDGWISNSVVICPNATSLAQVTETCSGAVTKYADDADANIVTIAGHNYWKIDGLTSTGGLSLFEDFALKDTLSRLEVSVDSTHEIQFGTVNGLTAAGHNIVIEFDPTGHNWDLTGLTWQDIDLTDDGTDLTLGNVPGVDTWGVSINTANDTITVTVPSNIGTSNDIEANSILVMEVGSNATHQSTGTNLINNPGTVGSYEVHMTITNTATETGEVEIPIVDDDTVNVTSYIDTILSFDIDTAYTDINCDASGGTSPCDSHSSASDGAGYVVDLGEMTLSGVNKSGDSVLHADGVTGSINYIWFDLESNADAGTVVTVVSANEELSGPGSNSIPSVVTGSEQQIAALSGLYGLNHRSGFTNSATTGSLVVHTDCDCTSGDTYYCDVRDSGTPIEVFNSNSNPVDDGRVQWAVGAAPDSDSGTGTYTDQLTFVATSTF